MSLVSVVLPTFNRAVTLARAIDSVLQQTYIDLELIIIDDGSTDETKRVLQDCLDPRVRTFRLPSNKGASAARNVGINNARGDLIAFQDSDDYWYKDKLFASLQEMTEAVGVVYSDMDRIAKDGSILPHHSPDVTSGVLVDKAAMRYHVEGIGVASCLIRKRYLESVGGFNESLAVLEDLDLLIRLSGICRFAHIRRSLMAYYESAGQMSDAVRVAAARRQLLALHKDNLEKWFFASELVRCHKLETQQAPPYGNGFI